MDGLLWTFKFYYPFVLDEIQLRKIKEPLKKVLAY